MLETFAKEYIDHYWPTDASVTADAGLRWFFDQYSRLLPEICRYALSWHISPSFALYHQLPLPSTVQENLAQNPKPQTLNQDPWLES